MKKILLATLLCGVAAVAFGQGQVQFRNYYPSTTPAVDGRVWIGEVGTGTLPSGQDARAALIGGPTTLVAASAAGPGTLPILGTLIDGGGTTWVNFQTGTSGPNRPGYVAYGATPARVVTGVDWGGQALVQLVAWTGPYDTFAAAWTAGMANPNVLVGFSNPLTLTLPSSSTSTALTYLWGLQAFAMHPVPEPATLALAGLGAAALLIFRRRN